MSHDTLSDVLRSVRLRSAAYYFVACEGKWAAEAPASREIAKAVMPGAEHVFEYHVLTAGECWAAIVGEQPLRLAAGDIIVLPHGDPHVLSSAPGMRADPNPAWYHEMALRQRPFRLAHRGAGPEMMHAETSGADPVADAAGGTALVCGFMGCDLRPFNPLISALPRLLHLPASEGGAWHREFLRLAVAESTTRRAGSEALLERISEMMFIDSIRRHVERMPEHSTGWLAGLNDRLVGKALALLHAQPADAWTIEELSRRVGLSRSALHDRFLEKVGQPPMQYLTGWRMQIAAQLLSDTRSSVAAIGQAVGYESEAAFSRAFKRFAGTPPATWRRHDAGG